MAQLHEVVETRLPLEQAFAFIADFSNSERWDPGTAWSKALGDPTPAVGKAYQLGVRMGGRVAPMEYRITELQPNARVVLRGSGSNVEATDDIGFEATATGTRIDYRANIRLTGWMRLLAPFAGGAVAKIGRDAREGMQSTLDGMAAA
jgi:carbon monoxide dehydrogenase subunit G